MEHEGYYLLGTFVRTHGVRGHLIVKLDVDDPSVYRKLESIWIETNGKLLPFTITSATLNGEFLNISVDGVADKNSADLLVRSRVFMPLAQLPKLKGKRLYLHEVKGMMAIDKNAGELGRIEQIYDLPEQPVASVMFRGKELLFPLITTFIERADMENKVLYLKLPDGLIDIYL